MRRSLAAGEVVFRLGAQGTNLYLIESGLVTLTMPMQIGGREEDIRIDERLAAGEVAVAVQSTERRLPLLPRNRRQIRSIKSSRRLSPTATIANCSRKKNRISSQSGRPIIGTSRSP